MNDRIFTLTEARAMVPEVDRLLTTLQRRKRKLEETQGLMGAIQRSTGADGHAIHTDTREVEARARDLIRDMRGLMRELRALPVQVKDIDKGLVDWLADRDGQQVLLCWQRGEPTVDWWHTIPDGFAGRRRIVPEEWE